VNHTFTRREFLAASTAFGAGLATSSGLDAAAWKAKPSYQKALIGLPDETTLEPMKAAGFDGIEFDVRRAPAELIAQAPRIAAKLEMRIHSLLHGWVNFNSPDADKVSEDLAGVRRSLEIAGRCGADAILLVPCRLQGMAMPEPRQFDVEIDEKTDHLRRVVDGDNAPYREYIAAHDRAVDTSRAAIEKLIPDAEKAGVIIALENVGNNLWRLPAAFAHFVASFDSPWVQAYFDVANHIQYAPPEDWIRALGGLIKKVHIKGAFLSPDGTERRQADVRSGNIDWPTVRKALAEVGYQGWLTIEGSRALPLEEQNRRLDLIIAGK
jgi:hexulose-6-phosphate isomerase